MSVLSTEKEMLARWVRQSCRSLASVRSGAPWDDLNYLGEMIGPASIVALTEGAHGAAEALEFRNRAFEYLAREKGFTAIAIESGIVESRVVHDYVRGGMGEFRVVMAQGIGWTFDRLPQNQDLVQWMRQYNARASVERKLNFYGFDVPGSPGYPRATRGMATPLVMALDYLEFVDHEVATELHARLDCLLPNLRFDVPPSGVPGYERLTAGERDALTAAIADLTNLFERSEARYTSLSPADDYGWSYRAALGARQVDNWLRQIPLGMQPPHMSGEVEPEYLAVATEVRDRAQADNLEWIIAREAARGGKVLVYAHQYHLSKQPVIASWFGTRAREVAGSHLYRRFGAQYCAIANALGTGQLGTVDVNRPLGEASEDSLDYVARRANQRLFLLDLRAAPRPIKDWLGQLHDLGVGADRLTLAIGRAFDGLLYVGEVTPALQHTSFHDD